MPIIVQKMVFRLATFFFLFNAIFAFAGPGAVDTTFDVVLNGTVYSLLTQPDGKILIGGSFSSINGVYKSAFARLYPDGSLDTSFTNVISGTVYASVIQPDGKIIVGGKFGTTSQTRQNVARLNVDGSIDGTFTNSAPNEAVYALALQNDGRILMGGSFVSVGNSNHYYIERLNTDGTVDNSFNPGVIYGQLVNAIAIQSDGNILIGGSFSTFTTYSLTRNNIARLLTNGSPDITYQATANSSIQSVYLQPDGRSVWGGSFTTMDSVTRPRVARLNTDGTLDTGFSATIGANNNVFAVTEDTNDNLYVGGVISSYNNSIREGVARVYADGTLDASFNNTTNFATPQIQCLAIQSDGRILAGGIFTSFNSFGRTNLVRLYGDNYPAEITVQPLPRNVVVGTNVTFSVEVSNPTAVSYQWLKNGTPISGATFSEYTLFNVQMADAGNYSVEASTGFGGTTSSNALLQVGIAPAITQAPTNLTVAQGQTATFTAAASGTPLNYYWFFGQNVVGTNATLTLTNVSPNQAGSYYFVASNFVAAVTNTSVRLSVLYPITITTNPSNQSVVVGYPVAFAVSATGNPLNYQWFDGTNAIPGAIYSVYNLNSVALTNAGNYSVIISNQFNSVTSSIAVLTVGIPPQTLQFNKIVNGSLTIQMAGTPGFNYVMQTTTNLQPPAYWQNTATNPADTNGVWSYLDTNVTLNSSLFYRVKTP